MLLTMPHQEGTLMYYTFLTNGVSMHLIKRMMWALIWIHRCTCMIMHLSQRGQTPLHFACKHGHIMAIQYLLTAHFANVSSQDKVCPLKSHSIELSAWYHLRCKQMYISWSIKLWVVMTNAYWESILVYIVQPYLYCSPNKEHPLSNGVLTCHCKMHADVARYSLVHKTVGYCDYMTVGIKINFSATLLVALAKSTPWCM